MQKHEFYEYCGPNNSLKGTVVQVIDIGKKNWQGKVICSNSEHVTWKPGSTFTALFHKSWCYIDYWKLHVYYKYISNDYGCHGLIIKIIDKYLSEDLHCYTVEVIKESPQDLNPTVFLRGCRMTWAMEPNEWEQVKGITVFHELDATLKKHNV